MDGRRGERCLHRPARPRPVMVEMTEIGVSDLGDDDPVGAKTVRFVFRVGIL